MDESTPNPAPIPVQEVKPLEEKKEEIPRLSYYNFISLPRCYHYFPTEDLKKYLQMVPEIKNFINKTLEGRPYEEEELAEALFKHSPILAAAYDVIWGMANEQSEDDGGDSAFKNREWKSALEDIAKGIEIRFNRDKDIYYWGLTSSLDRPVKKIFRKKSEKPEDTKSDLKP